MTVVATLLDRQWQTWQVSVKWTGDQDRLTPRWTVTAWRDGDPMAVEHADNRSERDRTVAQMICEIRRS